MHRRVRVANIHPVSAYFDPTRTHTMAFPTFFERLRITPATFSPVTPPPAHLSHVKRYPDGKLWMQAYSISIDKFDADRVIDWQLDLIPDWIKPLPLAMAFLDKRVLLSTKLIIKPRYTLRGD